MSARDTYEAGMDILGANAADFMPWMGLVGGALQGVGGLFSGAGATGKAPGAAPTADDVKKAVAAAEQKAKLEKAKADAAHAKTVEYVTLGAVGVAALVGTMILLTRRK